MFILKAILWVIGSIILIHIIGLLGVFLAISYPIWWLFFPDITPCFFCRWKKEGETCPVCKNVVTRKSEGPKTIKSVAYNMLAILVLTVISIPVIYIETKALSYFGISPLDKTVSFVIPGTGHHRIGEIFPLRIDLTGVKGPLNTVMADISYDPQYIEVEDINTDGSFATVFVEKMINNDAGFARISGGVPNPGVTCSEGCHFGSFILKTKKAGTVNVTYLPSSLVLANDGRGTNILRSLGSASFLILPEKLSDDEISRQNAVYNANVLGEQAGRDNPQLHFYRGNPILETSVLGASDNFQIENTRKTTWLAKALNYICKYDNFVLDSWKTFLSRK